MKKVAVFSIGNMYLDMGILGRTRMILLEYECSYYSTNVLEVRGLLVAHECTWSSTRVRTEYGDLFQL